VQNEAPETEPLSSTAAVASGAGLVVDQLIPIVFRPQTYRGREGRATRDLPAYQLTRHYSGHSRTMVPFFFLVERGLRVRAQSIEARASLSSAWRDRYFVESAWRWHNLGEQKSRTEPTLR